MKTVLVTTDLSVKSKAALRFAIQLASQSGFSLTFFHSYHILKPTGWSIPTIVSHEKSESTKILRKLTKFVDDVYSGLNLPVKRREYVVKHGPYPDNDIMEYAADNHFSYICMSRKGHGKTIGLFGSIVSKLIKTSKVPIIVVPENYRRKLISRITFASDLENLNKELAQVIGFNTPLNAELELLHFKTPADDIIDKEKLNHIEQVLAKFKVTPHYSVLDYQKTLIANINDVISYSRPSVLVMFTNQKRTWFEKIFMSSITAEYSSLTNIPLVTFYRK